MAPPGPIITSNLSMSIPFSQFCLIISFHLMHWALIFIYMIVSVIFINHFLTLQGAQNFDENDRFKTSVTFNKPNNRIYIKQYPPHLHL